MVSTAFVARAAVLLAASRYAAALGTAIVHNQCDFDVYLWSVSDLSGSMQTLSANGGEYTEAYQSNPDGGGISIKVGRDAIGQNVTQFEYTLEGDGLWYDLSLINGFPFVEFGVSVVPSDSSCSSVVCPAGLELCAAAYMTPTDNWATAECASTASTVVLLCSGEDSTSGSASVTSVASSAAATATAVTVFSSSQVTVAASTTAVDESTTASTTEAHATGTHRSHSHAAEEAEATTAALTTASAVQTTAAPASTQADGNVIVHTTFVTYVVTVEERDAAPTPEPVAKRQIHRHEHGQAQQKRHEHGHVHHQVDA